MAGIIRTSAMCWLVFGAALLVSTAADAKGFRTLYEFKGGSEGKWSYAPLTIDAAGSFYGTTAYGGTGCGRKGCGTVFRFAPDGTYTVLHAFANRRTDGAHPWAGLIFDEAGNLYGTTEQGGRRNVGTIFKLASDGTETVLHSFGKIGDGAYPFAGLIADKVGNLYGTTAGGGVDDDGTVFKVGPDGRETVLYAFEGLSGDHDGAYPEAALILDKSGNLYGTTSAGGANDLGTIFKVAPDGTETILYSFKGSNTDGAYPETDLKTDTSDNLYGTTSQGGQCNCGTVFKIAPDNTETMLYAFKGGSDGAFPLNGVVLDKAGNLYGITSAGGAENAGVVFTVTPDSSETVLHTFTRGPDGAIPHALLPDGKDSLYGTTSEGGKRCGRRGCGTIFRIEQ